MENKLWDIVRNMCKYGDHFAELIVDPDSPLYGIQRVKTLNPFHIQRNENEFGILKNFRQELPENLEFQSPGSPSFEGNRIQYVPLDKNQIVHFRLQTSDPKFYPYGKSIASTAVRIFRSLKMMEDAMLVYRLSRAPERRVFYIDTGTLPTVKAEAFMERLKEKFKKEKYFNTNRGAIDSRYNPMPVHKDSQIPLLDGRTITIEQLAKEQKEGKDNWVYSIQDETHKLVPGKVTWCDKNYRAEKLIKVWLDDNTYVITAPEHPFMLRDGSELRADELQSGQALMPFYRNVNNKGYERCYNPASKKDETTHTLVAKDIYSEKWEEEKRPVVHHKEPWLRESNKLNNSPDNLKVMDFWEHREWHQENIKYTLLSPENLEASRKRLIAYNQSDAHRKKVSEDTKKYKKAEKMGAAYNGSALHKEHNKIRRAAQLSHWSDPEKKAKHSKAMKWVIPTECIELRKEIYKEDPKLSRDNFIPKFLTNSNILELLEKANKNFGRDISKISKNPIISKLKELGYEGFAEYKAASLEEVYKNHKVDRIEILTSPEDVYCMTVVGSNGENDRHNFATLSLNIDGSVSKSGLFLKNSADEDFFIPIKGKSGTKIETLPGAQNLGDVDDVKYFRDKLMAALKVPKDFIVEKDSSPERKANLSQLDVKFARSVARIQKAVANGLESIARRHLKIKKFPISEIEDLRVELPDPSDMFTKRKLDVEEQKSRVIAGIQTLGLFTNEYILKQFYDLTDLEIKELTKDMESQVADQQEQGLMPEQGAKIAGNSPEVQGMEQSANGVPQKETKPKESVLVGFLNKLEENKDISATLERIKNKLKK